MSILVSFNGSNYIIPQTNEVGWGNNLDAYFVAIPAGCLQKIGGNFTLSAETDFGGSFGLKSLYLKSRSTNPASTGILRLANGDNVSWRNNLNTLDLPLSVNSLDQLLFNGTQIALNSFTLNRAIISNGSGNLAVSATTDTEIGYVSGVTSAIQSQLNSKLNLAGGTMSGIIAMGSNKITGLAAATTNGDALRYEQLINVYLPLAGGTLTGTLILPNGLVGTPSIAFVGDIDTGLYHQTNEINFACGGIRTFTVDTDYIYAYRDLIPPVDVTRKLGIDTNRWLEIWGSTLYMANGTNSLPSISFGTDTNTGFYRYNNDVIGITTAGVLRSIIAAASFDVSGSDQFLLADGTALSPGLGFSGNTNTGIYRSGSNQLAFSTAGTNRLIIGPTGNVVLQTGVLAITDGLVSNPGLQFKDDANVGIYRIGTDNLGISTAGNKAVDIGPLGTIKQPLQPCFMARNSTFRVDVTGDGTSYTLIFDTEIYDQGTNYNNATGIFTAPITGRYLFTVAVNLLTLTAAQIPRVVALVTSNRQYTYVDNFAVASSEQSYTFSILADMDASDTAYSVVNVSGGGLTVDVNNSAVTTVFSGSLIN